MATKKKRTVKKKNVSISRGKGSATVVRKGKAKMTYGKKGKLVKGKTVYKDASGKKVKEKVKYNKDGTIKKIVTKKGGKKKLYKGKNALKKYNKANYPNMTKAARKLLKNN